MRANLSHSLLLFLIAITLAFPGHSFADDGFWGDVEKYAADHKDCNLLLRGAEEAKGELQKTAVEAAGTWGGRLLEKLIGKLHTVSDIEEGAGLATAGLSGSFLGEHRLADFTLEANRALTTILASEDLTDRLGRQLVRLGLLTHTSKMSDFAKFYVLAHNQTIDLRLPRMHDRPIEDDIVREYLAKLLKQKIASASPTDLLPVSAATRLSALLTTIQNALVEIDPNPVQRDRSLKSLDFALTESAKLKGALTPEALDSIFDQLVSSAEFRTRELNIPNWARIVVGQVPLMRLLFIPWDLATKWYYKETELAVSRHEATQVDFWHKRTPRTLHIYFGNRDIKNLTGVAESFVAKYANPQGPSVFSDEFAEDFLTAYPEVRDYFSEFYTNEKMVPHAAAGDAFSNYHQEISKILIQTANLFSVLRLDQKAFPKLNQIELIRLKAIMVGDLRLNTDQGVLDADKVDLLITSFITSALGKARNSMINSISAEYEIDERAGSYDYNRRALYLLHHYRTLSYSFARQNSANQTFLTEIMDQNYQASLQELLRLEAPSASFDFLHALDAEHLSFLFYQFLLSESKERNQELTISSSTLASWIDLKQLLVTDTNAAVSSTTAYQTYLNWLKQGTALNPDIEWDRVVLRLRAVMGLPASEVPTLEAELQLLTGPERQLFIQLLDRSPVFFHRLNELFVEILIENGAKNLPLTASIDDFLMAMIKMLSSIQGQHYDFTRITNATHSVRVFLRPVVEKLQENEVSPHDLGQMDYELQHYSYGEVVHPL